MNECMHACIHTYMYIHVCVPVCICLQAGVHVCMFETMKLDSDYLHVILVDRKLRLEYP